MVNAEHYDELIEFASRPPDTDATVSGLARLAAGGRALELGVGTGRIAISLATAGIEVQGIEIDPAMAEQLRAKPGGRHVGVHLGDMVDVDVDGAFTLVYAVFGTLFMLDTQDAQVRCVRNVARHLMPGGKFVVEALVPRPVTYTDDQKVTAVHADADLVVINVSRHEPVEQVVTTHQLLLRPSGADILPVRIRYTWPTELDLMARLAGLELIARWSDWDGRPFEANDPPHISIYGPAGT
ncbi:MAG: class I SAM-dependent methyltransferase [Actinomycetota bacterium]|nr:class I SAM-dependent methyltransferase [Actinomycetota bacterium]